MKVINMRIAIVDDLPQEADRLKAMLRQEFHNTHTDIHRLDIYNCAEDLFKVWQEDMYDLILLDIYMGQMTGVEAAHKIRETDDHVKLVFCTTSNEFASESYVVGASYYLHKPYDASDIQRMVKKVRPADYELMRYIILPDGQKLILRDIISTEYENHVIYIHCKRGPTILTRMGQAAFEALLTDDPYLLPCSKGLLVNLYEVVRLDGDEFTMSDDTRIPISRRKAKDVQKIYNDFLFRKMRKEMLV